MSIDSSARVAPSARVDPGAVIGPQCVIGEYCVIEADVVMGAGNRLEPYIFIKRWTSMGDSNEISAGTVLGTDPLDRSFTGERSYLRIGSRNRIREHYTISRGTQPESVTTIGDDNYIMTSGHVAHNCIIGNSVTIASCSLVAGYATVEDQVFISGGVVIHQYSKIGRLAMIAGNVRVNMDAPPFFLYAGFNNQPAGLNRVGLRRAGFSREEISTIKRAYEILYHSNLKLAQALGRIEAELPNPHTRHLVEFIRSSKRGIARPGNTPGGTLTDLHE